MEFVDPVEKDFYKKEIVFKIVIVQANGTLKDFSMVNTREDYERKIYTHQYTPLLFVCNLKIRLAYLYGCLNYQLNVPREEEYLFMWRKIGTNEWNKWFEIKPYNEDLFTEVNIIHP